MKKKKIEMVAPVELRKPKRKYYMMAAAVVELDGEDHLICDFYRKERRSQTFIFRAVYTQHDWGLWDPDTGKWSRGSIANCYNTPSYDECDMMSGPGIPQRASWNNTATDSASKDTIRGFCESMNISYRIHAPNGEWWRYLIGIEKEIKVERSRKANLSRSRKLDARNRDLPAIPEDFISWADCNVFFQREYVYYKRRGRYADCRCSKCSHEYTIKTKRLETFEGQFEDIKPAPKNGATTWCPRCGTRASYKPRGRMKFKYGEANAAYLIQPFRETGAVIRYIEARKEWSLEEDSRVYLVELGREYREAGKRRQVDWYLHDNYTGEDTWCDRNVGGMGNISMPSGYVYTRNKNAWTPEVLRYSGLAEYIAHKGIRLKPAKYLQAAEEYPLEKLVKMHLYDLVEELVKGDATLPAPHSGKIEKALGIRRCRLGMLRDAEGDKGLLRALQEEQENTELVIAGKRKGKGEWTEEQIRKVRMLQLDKGGLRTTLKYMSIEQFLNRIERYQGQLVPDEDELVPGCLLSHIRGTAQEYMDYIRMRAESGYGMERSTDLFPRDLKEAHRQMVLAHNQAENDIRAEKCNKEYPDIRKRYRRLKAAYGYKADGLFVRPAKDPREIIEEGQILHHCVGRGDYYIRKHNEGTSYILFLRHLTSPNDPYITIEIQDRKILQWYGRNDTKPDKEIIERWLADWIDHLKEKEEQKAGTAAGFADAETLAAAAG